MIEKGDLNIIEDPSPTQSIQDVFGGLEPKGEESILLGNDERVE